MLALRKFNMGLKNNLNYGNLSSVTTKNLPNYKALLVIKYVPICQSHYKFSSSPMYNSYFMEKKLLKNEFWYKKMSTTANEPSSDSKKVLSNKEKLKKAIKEYGSIVAVFHVTISLLSLGGFYLLVSSGVNVFAILDWAGINTSKFAAGTSTFVIAYAVHKVFVPVRMSITLAATPVIVRYLRKKKFLK